MRTAAGQSAGPRVQDAPVAIEVRDLEKTFRIAEHRIDTFKERALHPFARAEYRELRPLRGISFDVHRGEFFGIAGRNGSGKSTLLKILASIYRADAGTIRMAGRQAPFIELGVGFKPEFTARENIVLNGVMMGLTRREALRSVDAVLDFAELREFSEMKLKNYSSGMTVRLAFAVMIQADADIMLIDEVLAVGDAAFAQKCADVFHDLKDSGKTVLLVTHDMGTIEEYCDRALLLDDGEITHMGEPEEVAQAYLRLNFDTIGERRQSFEGQTGEEDVEVVRAWLEDGAGREVGTLEQGQPINLRIEVEARRDIPLPSFGWMIKNADGVEISGFGTHLDRDGEVGELLPAGERARVAASIDNQLVAGRYFVDFWMLRNRQFSDVVIYLKDVVSFVVYGGAGITPGVVSLPARVRALPANGPGAGDNGAP